MPGTSARPRPSVYVLLAAILLLIGAGLRLFDLTDQPIDFHPTRQLRGMIVARGMVYEMLPGADPDLRRQALAFQASTGQYEPPILERITALTDLAIGREVFWVARIYSTLFWLIGGLALWATARRFTARRFGEPGRRGTPGATDPVADRSGEVPTDAEIAALLALAFYLLLPFAVQAGRSIQPDPMMVMWMALAGWAVSRWSESCPHPPDPLAPDHHPPDPIAHDPLPPDPHPPAPLPITGEGGRPLASGEVGGTRASTIGRGAWGWALAAGLFAGLAVLTKAVSVFTLACGMAALALYTFGAGQRRPFWKLLLDLARSPQTWLMVGLSLAPTLAYYLGRQGRAAEYFSTWTLSLRHMWLEPGFYAGWLGLAAQLMTPPLLLLALVGVWLARGRERWLLVGLWLGYFFYGMFLPYQMDTHSYYHLQVTWLVGLSLVPAFRWAARWALQRSVPVRRAALIAVIALGAISAWQALVPLYGQDYRNEPAYWSEIASFLPADGKIIALTQDYGYRLMYYGWRKVTLWPNRGEIKLTTLRGSTKEFEEYFAKRTEGKRYFLITAFRQYEDQPALQQVLTERYPVAAQGQGYIIFDLAVPNSNN